MAAIPAEEFQTLSRYIRDISGIYLDDSKKYLVDTRLGGLLKELGCASYSELYFKTKTDATQTIKKKIIDLITTGETLFFRDASPFDLLQHKVLPDLIDKRKPVSSNLLPTNIRIWSAACSSGQEVYSIAMVLKELFLDTAKYNIRLIGTDISDEAVAKASYGTYNKFEIDRGLPKERLAKYFTQLNGTWKIRDEIRALATFKKMNLMDDFSVLGKFDIVFCRNVAIYFTEEDKAKLFRKIASVLEPDGYLIIGSTESLSGTAPDFEPKRYLRSVFYQKKGA
jgi:chemotaxis protein methyltransferase CheR